MHISLFLCNAYAMDSDQQYHLPYTDAEIKANQIINIATGITPDFPAEYNHWSILLDYIQTWPHQRPDVELQYQNLFTKDFIYGWAREEERLVNIECDGKYDNDRICGLDFVALTCCQDGGGIYLYRTLEESESHAIIAVIWYSAWPDFQLCREPSYDLETFNPENYNAMVLYKLVKRNEAWLLDGLVCSHNKKPYFHINFQGYRGRD